MSSSITKRRCVLVCQYRSCERSGAVDVLAAFRKVAPTGVLISESNCLGQCGSGPTVRVTPDEIWYRQVTPEDVPVIVEQHLQNDQPVQRLLHPRFHPRDDAYIPIRESGSAI
jgi:(2Fe-2S) ferredoxin